MKRSFSDSNILIVLIRSTRTIKEIVRRKILINIIEEKVELSFSLSFRSTETDLIPVRLKPKSHNVKKYPLNAILNCTSPNFPGPKTLTRYGRVINGNK